MSESASNYLADWQDFSKHRASAISLLAANGAAATGSPLLGLEHLCDCAHLLGRKRRDRRDQRAEDAVLQCLRGRSRRRAHAAGNEVLFCAVLHVHYGLFCLVHGVFVFALLGGEDGGLGGPLGDWDQRFATIRETGTLWGILALAGSHLFSFVKNYLIGGESRSTTLPQLMSQPYGRIVVLHIAILFGAFATMALGSPIWLLMILIVGKTALDLNMHLREHRNASQEQSDQGHDGQNRGNDGFSAGS